MIPKSTSPFFPNEDDVVYALSAVPDGGYPSQAHQVT